jgi:hypothetical protein
MTEIYYEKYGRNQKRPQHRIFCDSCHALIGDSGPGKDSVPWGTDNICPICNGKIHDPNAPKWSPKPR